MRNKRIWVLIANTAGVRLCSSTDGSAIIQPLTSMTCPTLQITQLLHEGAREKTYDGLIVIAVPEIAFTIRRLLTAETATLLIGDIILDPSINADGKAKAEACSSLPKFH